MKQQKFTTTMKAKIEPVSDDEEVHCRLCHKAFASPVALRNHARMDHIAAYQTGDPSVYTKSGDDPVVLSKSHVKNKQKIIIQKRKHEILSSMEPTSITSLASNNVSYIIIKSEDPMLHKKKTIKKEREKKQVVLKREKVTEPITGPFECLEPSSLGADGACHQIFFSCCAYSAHARHEHARRRRAPRCQVCERPLPSRPDDPTSPYACETCGQKFQTADEVLDHMRKDHVKIKPYKCSLCHKRFTQKGGVLQHMRMHTGDRPYTCTFCSKAFTQKSGLDQHLRTHTKVKPYRCVICSKSFIQSVHLKQHMRTHTNVAPFQCGICEKRFKQIGHLSFHLKNHNIANMTDEQREKYQQLMGEINAVDCEVGVEVETRGIEIQEIPEEVQEMTEEIQGMPEEMQEMTVEMQEMTEEIQETPEEMQEMTEEMQEMTEEMQEMPEEMQEMTEEMQEMTEEVVIIEHNVDEEQENIIGGIYLCET